MRDIIVTLTVIGVLPFILKYPYYGILAWSWIGYMNPHRLSWGFARDAPFAMIIGATTLVAMLFMKDKIRITWTRESIILLVFILWMVLTTFFATQPVLAEEQLIKVLKIQIMIFATLVLIKERHQLDQLIWIIVISLGLYGVKGGIFTLTTGGAYHVMGPNGTFIGGNNEIGLALIMTLPLMRYLQLRMTKAWQRNLFTIAMITTVIAILGTQSRGALLGLCVMGLMLILKSRRRVLILLLVALMVPLTIKIMPDAWFARMQTIETYKEDQSAMGRINAWWFAFNMAVDRPLVGGGFQSFQWKNFQKYAPDPNDVHDAHSIYFEVLGEQGFVGFGLFMLLGWYTWRSGSWIIQATKNRKNLTWALDLAAMTQVSIVGYASAGAFLGLGYFDLYYHLVTVIIILKLIVIREIEQETVVDKDEQLISQNGNAFVTGNPG